MRISDWSSDVCSSDLNDECEETTARPRTAASPRSPQSPGNRLCGRPHRAGRSGRVLREGAPCVPDARRRRANVAPPEREPRRSPARVLPRGLSVNERSEEHTSELQSLMRISYAVFCLKKKTT